MDEPCTLNIEHDDVAARGEELKSLTPQKMWEQDRRMHNRNMSLLEPGLTDEEKIVLVLHMLRSREVTEYNPKLYIFKPTRFCHRNIAFFDLDKESEFVNGPLFHEIPPSKYLRMDMSVNVISIKIAESDVPYPINIYGTVLARDRNDYRCVYIFKRERDDPQLITGPDDTLTLTGPYRALSGSADMYFEFHLKIKCEGSVDQDFSKGLIVCSPWRHRLEPGTLWLESCQSTVDMLYIPIPLAVEASLGVNILNGMSKFTGKIFAWTTGIDEASIIMYNSGVEGTETTLGSDGSIPLTRDVVVVPRDEKLALSFSVCGTDGESECIELAPGHACEKSTHIIGPYELQVKIIWKGVFKRQHSKMWKKIGDITVLW